MKFLRRIIAMIKLRREQLPIEELEEIELVYEIDGMEMAVTLHCSCQNAVVIASVDKDYFPALPHFYCLHCDRVCDIRHCIDCRVYSKMTDARDATIEE